MRILRSAVARLSLWLLWGTLISLLLLVTVAVFIPFYGIYSEFYPSAPPGMSPSVPFEFAGIARYRGTLWENPFWADLFWSVGCNGLCWWLPVFIAACVITKLQWRSLSLLGGRVRLALLIACGGVTLLWVWAAMDLAWAVLD